LCCLSFFFLQLCCLFLLLPSIVLSVLLRFAASDCPFCIFKLLTCTVIVIVLSIKT
jgi:hypothetical protein